MGRNKFIKPLDKLGSKKNTLEIRLMQFFVLLQMIWSLVVMIMYFVMGMPIATVKVYGFYFVGLLLYFTLGNIIHKGELFGNIYMVFLLAIVPILWYFSGGSKSAAGILFVCQLCAYVMCMRGTKQKIFIIISLMSSGMIQGMSRRLPYPEYPMDPGQYARGASVLGLATCLLIGSLLIRQKAEYMHERDAALASEKELERSNSLQKNFLANMSHEIRSPLGIVMGFNNLIKESNDIKQIHDYSRDIEQSGNTLLTVINDILDYSKIESGKLDIIEVNYSFGVLANEIDREIGLKCAEKGLKFIPKIGGDVPNNLYGDNIRIKQCLLNVLSNAVKYTEQGVITFNVECLEKTDNKLCKLKFVVEDTGKGISEEAMPKLFSAFQRLDEGMNRGIEGTGLGLAITKNLLDEMNGTIEVESKLGAGTTFTIYLDQRIGEEVAIQEISDEENLEGIRVLVVDDTVLNLTLVRKLLEREKANVVTIDNGKDCLADVHDNKYDVILLDHMMPDMNGVEVFENMRKNGGVNAETPVVMLTANAMAGASQEYLCMGFDGYLSKPISPVKLKEMILNLTRR